MSLTNIIIVVMCIFILCTISIGLHEYNNLQIENSLLKTQMQMLESQAKEEQQKFIKAQQKAAQSMQTVQTVANSIIKQKVSKNCESAIAWGIAQSGRMANAT